MRANRSWINLNGNLIDLFSREERVNEVRLSAAPSACMNEQNLDDDGNFLPFRLPLHALFTAASR